MVVTSEISRWELITVSKRRYWKSCTVCEKDYPTSRKDSVYCSDKCRKQAERNEAYIKEETLRIKRSLDSMIECALEPGPYNEKAWISIVALSSYLARVVSEKALEATNLGQ